MKTKFIGLDGFGEIEAVSTKKTSKKSAQLSTAQKSVRFAKRAANLCAKNIKTKNINKTNKKKTAAKKPVRAQSSILDRQYAMSRRAPLTSGSAMESLKYLKTASAGKTYAHSAPAEPRAHKTVKKKAILAVAACLTAIMLSCVTVASALDAPQTKKTGEPKTTAAITAATKDEVSYSLNTPDMYVNNVLSSLYIDGELIGTTDEGEALENALAQYLVDYRADYDDTTTTEYVNNVRVEKHGLDNSELKSADELMEEAKGKVSVRLETDWSYDIDIDYETDITYDEDEDSDYEKVVTEGEKGAEQINVRLVYVDGAFESADVVSTERKKEPVTEELIRGCKQGKKENASSSGESSGQFIWPFPHTHSISSLFEWRWGRMHQGIDIAGGDDYGQPIVAADGGKVTWAGNDGGGYGNYVMIDHGNGYVTVYGHASELACSTGDYVSQGQVIAYVGSTGNSTGPHLHFEIRYDGEYLNPLDFVW